MSTPQHEAEMRALQQQRACRHPHHLEVAKACPPTGRWELLMAGEDGAAFQQGGGLRVITSVGVEDDGNCWLHASCSREERLPSWADLRNVKQAWCGERYAYIVLPPSERYVNINPNVHHLWCRLTDDLAGPALPEFSAVVTGTRTI